jgi:threonyl-tRNA synthetase
MPIITLPDGSQRSYPSAVTVAEVAASIGAGLAKAALAGRVDGRLVDTSFLIETDAQLAIVTDRDPDAMEIIRHSTAHLLAQAVKQLFPEAQVTIGPVIEDGFYYDFAYSRPFTPDDDAIERVWELAKADHKVGRRAWRVMRQSSFQDWVSITRLRSLPYSLNKRSVSMVKVIGWLCRGHMCPAPASGFSVDEAGRCLLARRFEQRNAAYYGTAWTEKEPEGVSHSSGRSRNAIIARLPRHWTCSHEEKRQAWCLA